MKRLVAALLLFVFPVSAGLAQKLLAIDLYRLGHFKRLHIYQHGAITYKLKDSRYKYRDTIADMGDSMLTMTNGEIIKLNEIRMIETDRSNWLLRKLAGTGIWGGIFIVAIDAVNNIGNQRPTIVDPPFIVVGTAMVATGLLIKVCGKRRLRPGKNTRLKILDLSPR